MQGWLKALMGGSAFASLGGVGLTTAAVLIVLLRVLLPKEQRKLIRTPLFLLIGNLVIVGFRALIALPQPADKMLAVVGMVLLLASIGRAGFLLLVDWLLGQRLKKPVPKIFRDILQAFVYFGVAFLTLPMVGLEPGQLLTTSALLTAVIGLSMQETMGNLFAGLAIQAQRPFDVGDWIKFDLDEALIGRVTEINWRATKVMTDDDVEVIVPNGTLAKAPIQNFTQPTRVSRRTATVSGPYEAAPHDVFDAILEGVQATPGVRTSPPPDVLLDGYGASGIDYRVRYYVGEFAQRMRIDSAVRVRIWYAFQRRGISIPFPIRDVRHIDQVKQAEKKEAASLAERRKAIAAIDFMADLADEVQDHLAMTTRVALYSDGEQIIRQGEDGDELFIVSKGEVVILVGSDPRRATEVARLGPGKFFGEMSLLTGEQRTATVVARGACEMYVIGHHEMQQLFEMDESLPKHFADVLARRKEGLEERNAGAATKEAATAAESNVLLNKIKSFFSL